MHNQDGGQVSRVEKVLCWVAHCDPEVYSDASAHDQFKVQTDVMALLLVTLVSAIVWWNTFASFAPAHPVLAVFVALLPALGIFLLDRNIIGGEMELSGDLREGAPTSKNNKRLIVVRILLTLLFSYVTSLAATLTYFEPSIKAWNESQRTAGNRYLMDGYAQRKADLHRQILEPLEQHLKDKTESVAELRPRLSDEVKQLNADRATAQYQKLEAARQLEGYQGRMLGAGAHYRDAMRQVDAADGNIKLLEQEIASHSAELAVAEKEAATLRKELVAAQREVAKQEQALDQSMQSEPAWIKPSDDPISRIHALKALEQDKERGWGVTMVKWGIQAVIIGLELLVILLKVLANVTSTIGYRKYLKLRQETIQLTMRYRAQHQQLTSERPNLRVYQASQQQGGE